MVVRALRSSGVQVAQVGSLQRGHRRGGVFAIGLVMLGLSCPSYAQSAADKATARELASSGIGQLNAGDAQAALISLQKAQALYDAPIHLLYIARAQTQLGQLVEATETYRTLLRAELEPAAPSVFRQAQVDGEKELQALEPRLAKLTIVVSPENVEGLSVSIDEQAVNVAVLGVPRASNPGRHSVSASAPGYQAITQSVELKEGAAVTITLPLTAGEPEEEKPQAADDEDEQEEDDRSDEPFETGPMGLIAGLRFMGAVPFGNLEKGTPMSEYFRGGLLARVDLGFRFLTHFGAKLYFSGALLAPGEKLGDSRGIIAGSYDSTAIGGMADIGIALMATSDPRKFGGFGELGVSPLSGYFWTQSISLANVECNNTAAYTGWSTRVSGGLNIPLAKIFTLTPTADFTLGQLGRRTIDDGCLANGGVFPDATDEKLDQTLHYQVQLGVGGDFHFGDDWFR